jgi:hypothetical protein
MLLLSLPMNSKDPMKGFHGMDCAGCDGRGMGRSVSPMFGSGNIDQAHTADEFVNLEEVETAFLVYRDLMSSHRTPRTFQFTWIPGWLIISLG